MTAHPSSILGKLHQVILNTFCQNIALKLSDDRKHLNNDFGCTDLRVDVVGTDQKDDIVLLQVFQKPHQIGCFTANTVQLVTSNRPDLARIYIMKHSLEIRPVSIVSAQAFVAVLFELIIFRQLQLAHSIIGALFHLNADTVTFVCNDRFSGVDGYPEGSHLHPKICHYKQR